MRKLVLDLSLAQIIPPKSDNMILLKKLGFIDVLSTVHGIEKVMKYEKNNTWV